MKTVRREISISPNSCVGCTCSGRLAFNEFEAVMEQSGYPMTRGELTKAAVGKLTIKPIQLCAAVAGAYLSGWISPGQASHCLEQVDVQRVVAQSGLLAWKKIRHWFDARKKRPIGPSEISSMLIARVSDVDDFAKIDDAWNERLNLERQERLSHLAALGNWLASTQRLKKPEKDVLACLIEALKSIVEDENLKVRQTLLGDAVLADIRKRLEDSGFGIEVPPEEPTSSE